MSAENAQTTKQKHYLTIITGLVIALIFLFYMFTFSVPIGNVAVLTTLGKAKKTIEEPGLYFKIPWVNKAHLFDARIQVSEDRFEETFTVDQKNLIVLAYILWQVEDPLTFLNANETWEQAEENLKQLVRPAKNAVFGRHALSELVSTDPDALQYDEIEKEIVQIVNQTATERYGIHVTQIGIKRLALPESITQNVFERMKQERENLAKKLRSEGDGEASRILARAKANQDRIKASAEALAKEIRADGDERAAKYYVEFAKNPELSIFLQQVEALKEALKEKATLILYSDSPPFNLLQKKPTIQPEVSQ